MRGDSVDDDASAVTEQVATASYAQPHQQTCKLQANTGSKEANSSCKISRRNQRTAQHKHPSETSRRSLQPTRALSTSRRAPPQQHPDRRPHFGRVSVEEVDEDDGDGHAAATVKEDPAQAPSSAPVFECQCCTREWTSVKLTASGGLIFRHCGVRGDLLFDHPTNTHLARGATWSDATTAN